MQQVPSINGGRSLVPLPSPSLTAPAEMQSHSLFLCPAVFPQAESTVSGGQTDRGVSGGGGAGSVPAGVWTLQKSKSSTAVSEK